MNEYIYKIVITQVNNNYSAHCPELPGVFTVGDTIPETLNYMLEAMQFHMEGLAEDGLPVPTPQPTVEHPELAQSAALARLEQTMQVQERVDLPEVESEGIDAVRRQSLASIGTGSEVKAVVSHLNNNSYALPFNRQLRWDVDKASRYIDTLLRGEPSPTLIFYRTAANNLLLLDGQQRLEALRRFYSGSFDDHEPGSDFALSDLAGIAYPGCTYRTLPERARQHLDHYYMDIVVVNNVDDAAGMEPVYRLYARLNSDDPNRTGRELQAAINGNR